MADDQTRLFLEGDQGDEHVDRSKDLDSSLHSQRVVANDNEWNRKAEFPVLPVDAFKPTEGQATAIEWLTAFCKGETDFNKVLLQGYAGTGKTWTINRVVEGIRRTHPHISFGMTAPTHKAVRQLYKHSELKDQLDFGTIHSFLGLKIKLIPDPKDKSKRTMIETFEPDKGMQGIRKIDEIRVLIIDESSMLSDELYNYVDDVIRTGRLLVIFMGDGLQIPPVGKKDQSGRTVDAIPFVQSQRDSRKIHMLELTEIVRQGAGNPIIEYSAAIREQHKHQTIQFNIPLENTYPTGITKVPRDIGVLRGLFRQYFCTPEFQLDPDHMKVIAWRNDTVDYFNKEIRLLINKAETLPKIIKGDKLVLDKPYFIGRTMLPNNEELDVMELEETTLQLKYFLIDRGNAFKRATSQNDDFVDTSKKYYDTDIKIYLVKAKAMDGRVYDLNILHEDDEMNYKEIRENIVASTKKAEFFETKELWKQFYDMEKKFAWAKYNYCLTAHKSQGSTYDYCISMEWDIDQNRDFEERNRIRYVAATRARNKLFIVK